MKQHKAAEHFDGDRATVVTIGTFDGVHVGHRKIIQRVLTSAAADALEAVALTFFPHPRMVLQKDVEIKLLNTIEERIQLLEQTGLDHLVVEPFTLAFSRLSAEEYVKDILVEQLRAKKVVIGYDHHFGRNRKANIEDLRHYGKRFGFEVEEIPEQDIDDVAISSTKIRKALHHGNLAKANTYLGSPFILTGTIARGKGLGKKMGYPTANLHVREKYKLIPAQGVYVVRAQIDGKTRYGMMSIGTNPTVGGVQQTIETYFFDLDLDLYDLKVQIEVLARIRDEKKFDDVDALVEAMKEDERYSRKFISDLNAQ